MCLELEYRMDDNLKPVPSRETGESVAVLPTFMEIVLDTVERVLEKSNNRSN